MNNNNFTCSICIDTKNSNLNFECSNCKNLFHKECINQWFKKSPTCPMCRHRIDFDDDFLDLNVDDLIMFNQEDLAWAIFSFYKKMIYDFIMSFFF
tara:strand:- start:148 stop:435 length:288 start_codon:yes stop_codon:yes gene_type:complete